SRVGLQVNGIKPLEPRKSEYYVEQPFELNFRAVYAQLYVFLQRLSTVERIARVDDFDIHPAGPSSAPYVELTGTIEIKTYKYIGSKADELAKGGTPEQTPSKPVGP